MFARVFLCLKIVFVVNHFSSGIVLCQTKVDIDNKIINEKINNLESKSKEKYVDMEVAIEFHRTIREYFPNHEPKFAEVSLDNNILDEIKKLKDSI